MSNRQEGGFTLIEALIAITISSLIVVLVGTTFVVQNRFYASQQQLSVARDHVRGGADVIATEIRSAMKGGVVLAGPRRLTVRTPMVLTGVCHEAGNDPRVYIEGGEAALDTAEVGGLAVRDALTGAWTYGNVRWGTIDDSGDPAKDCFNQGADTVGVRDNFHKLKDVHLVLGVTPGPGDVVMIFRETTFEITASELDPATYGLFRRSYEGERVEVACGLDGGASFSYRVGGVYSDTVTAGQLADIDVVRLSLEARETPRFGGAEDIEYGLAINVALRNVRKDGL